MCPLVLNSNRFCLLTSLWPPSFTQEMMGSCEKDVCLLSVSLILEVQLICHTSLFAFVGQFSYNSSFISSQEVTTIFMQVAESWFPRHFLYKLHILLSIYWPTVSRKVVKTTITVQQHYKEFYLMCCSLSESVRNPHVCSYSWCLVETEDKHFFVFN